MLIEKLDLSNLQGMPSEINLNVLDYMPNRRFSGLRTGMTLSGIGFGLIVAWTLVVTLYPFLASIDKPSWQFREMFYAIYLASPALFGGIGLIISYVIERKQKS